MKIIPQWLEVVVVGGERQREVERDETASASYKQGERLGLRGLRKTLPESLVNKVRGWVWAFS